MSDNIKRYASEDYVNNIIASSTPNTSFGITGASVGQTIRITAVDENGTPTAWEPVDLVLKSDFDTIMGSYITDIDTLVGGDA